MRNFVKGVKINGEVFSRYLFHKFPQLSESKISEGTSISPEVEMLMNDDHFHRVLLINIHIHLPPNGIQAYKDYAFHIIRAVHLIYSSTAL